VDSLSLLDKEIKGLAQNGGGLIKDIQGENYLFPLGFFASWCKMHYQQYGKAN
jgi:hypothetical protein